MILIDIIIFFRKIRINLFNSTINLHFNFYIIHNSIKILNAITLNSDTFTIIQFIQIPISTDFVSILNIFIEILNNNLDIIFIPTHIINIIFRIIITVMINLNLIVLIHTIHIYFRIQFIFIGIRTISINILFHFIDTFQIFFSILILLINIVIKLIRIIIHSLNIFNYFIHTIIIFLNIIINFFHIFLSF